MSSHPFEKEKELEAAVDKLFGEGDESLQKEEKDFFLFFLSKLITQSYLKPLPALELEAESYLDQPFPLVVPMTRNRNYGKSKLKDVVDYAFRKEDE